MGYNTEDEYVGWYLRAAKPLSNLFVERIMADKKEIERQVSDLALRIAEPFGFEVVEVAFRPGRDASLTIYIDKPGGIDLDDCEKFHNAVDAPLDELDPTRGGAYTLNVSSPGLDRPFRTARDFERHTGEKVEVRLYAPVKGNKYFEGILAGYDGNTVTLETDGETMKLELTRVAKVSLAIEFD